MFDSVTFDRSTELPGRYIDLGAVAEALLFYKTTNLMLDGANLRWLLNSIGAETTQRLIELPSVKSYFDTDLFGMDPGRNSIPSHRFIRGTVAPFNDQSKVRSKEHHIKHHFERALGKSHQTNRAALQFSKIVKWQKMTERHLPLGDIPSQSNSDLNDESLVLQTVIATLKEKVPEFELRGDWRYQLQPLDEGFLIDTNLDFDRINLEFKKIWPVDYGTLNPTSLLLSLLSANRALNLSSKHGSDMMVSSATSEVMQHKLKDIMGRQVKNQSEIELFQRITIGEGRSVREAINSGQRSFDEFLELMEHASQFRKWLSDQEPAQSLVQDYYSEMTAGTWAEKLPAKSFRWMFFTGAGVAADLLIPTGIGTVAGVALSAGDTFLLDKVAKGWKPNQFIEGPLVDFSS
ncbi:hypothetical protein N9P03_01295 [bacterium]|nr:hypothetical protein [bacterium]